MGIDQTGCEQAFASVDELGLLGCCSAGHHDVGDVIAPNQHVSRIGTMFGDIEYAPSTNHLQ
jgi:hypothetical protein